MSACEWVNDDLSGCETGTWLHFSYTYNILDVDAAYNQVDNLSVLIFNEQGYFVEKQDVDSVLFKQSGAMLEIEQPIGEYKILVFGGLDDKNYSLSELVVGKTQYEDVILSISRSSEASENSEKLDYLFHCNLDSVTVTDYYNIIEAPLVKNTNNFSILIQDDNYTVPLGTDFGVVIRSDNGAINYKNNIVSGNYVNYTPYNQFITDVTNESLDGTTVSSSVLVSYINTLRLIVDDDTTLSIIHLPTNERLVDISLTQYLLLTNAYYGAKTMEDQEYLDRQDAYSLIFYLDESDSSSCGYICTRFSVNGWIVRFNDAELKKD